MTSGQSPKLFFRSRVTGDLGFLVEKNGKQWIQLDRPAQEILKPYNEQDWDPQEGPHRFSMHQIGRVVWDCDKAFCRLLGLHNEARESWEKLSPKRREEWLREGPKLSEPGGDARRAYFQVCMGALLRYVT